MLHSLALVGEPQLQLECLLAAACTECIQGTAERQVQVLLRDIWYQLLSKLDRKLPDLFQDILLEQQHARDPKCVHSANNDAVVKGMHDQSDSTHNVMRPDPGYEPARALKGRATATSSKSSQASPPTPREGPPADARSFHSSACYFMHRGSLLLDPPSVVEVALPQSIVAAANNCPMRQQ